jgi:starch synthase
LNQYRPTPDPSALHALQIDPEVPYVLFVGRITRQKGIIHLVNAIRHFQPGVQVVLCAGAPDTAEIAREMSDAVDRARAESSHSIIWIREMLPKETIITLYTHAAIFVCPSVYEPFGIINLEAMATETAVVASAIGGIPEVVVPGQTGELVPLELKPGTFEPTDPTQFAHDLATAINSVALDPEKRTRYGRAGRQRAEAHFSWDAIADRTLELYRSLIG